MNVKGPFQVDVIHFMKDVSDYDKMSNGCRWTGPRLNGYQNENISKPGLLDFI